MAFEGNDIRNMSEPPPRRDEPSKIEDIKKGLYSRSAPDIRAKRRLHFREKTFDVKSDWENSPERAALDNTEPVELNEEYVDHSMSFFTKLLIGSALFFAIAVGIGAYLVFNGSNIVSANNVDIEVSGPVSVAGGDILPLDIQVSNKNNIKLEVVDLTVDFPEGTANPDKITEEMKTFRQTLDDIEPGGVSQKTVQAVVFGEENSKKQITVKVDYRVKGSNALFYKEKIYEVLVTSSPIQLTVDSYKEVNSGQQFDLTVSLVSNSQQVLKNLVLKGTYPAGFSFISSNVKPVGDNGTWKIGDLPSKGKKTITIKGKLEGQDDEDRVFRFVAGAASAKNDKFIGTQYITAAQSLTIKKPFISVNVSLDNDSGTGEYNAQFNSPVRIQVEWFNNLPTSVIDSEIHVKLSGSAYDKASVSPDQGYFQSVNNEIVWNKVTTPGLASIDAGGGGKVTFTVTPRDLGNPSRPIQNPDLSLSVSVQGKRNSETNVPEAIASSATRHIRVASTVALSGRVVRSSGPFVNTGTVPPASEKATTYTIFWTVYNASNNVSNAQVKAKLPPYVKWVNAVNPTTEDVTYNSVDGQITWNIGNLRPYTGSGAQKKEVAFQVSFEPGVDQIGKAPQLVGSVVLNAIDDFTGITLTSIQDELNTRYSTDPVFKDGDEVVVQ